MIEGFSCVNTRLALTQILINDNKNEKVLFDLYIDGKKQMKRISFKYLKGMTTTSMAGLRQSHCHMVVLKKR